MSTQLATVNQNQVATLDSEGIQKLLLNGNLSGMTPHQKNMYYMEVCRVVGLNHLTKPFDFITFQGKEVMYANKGCAEQLRNIHKIGLKIVDRTQIGDVYIVTTEALDANGRTDSSTGAINIAGLKGEALANAMMKCETKAKRRVTLSICGLNMLDDSEVDSIPGSQRAQVEPQKAVYADQPSEEETAQARLVIGYTIPFGKFKSRSLEEVGPNDLAGYVEYIEKKAQKDNKPIQGMVKEFIDRASEFIVAFEKSDPYSANNGQDVPY